MQPRVSIILATYNNPRYLAEAIASVRKQSYRDWELIIVNDASPFAATKEVISSFTDERIIYIENAQNIGNVRSAVGAMQIARGEYIARIDDDDVWLSPEKLQMQVAYLDSHPETVVIGSNIDVIDYDTGIKLFTTHYPLTDEEIRRSILSSSPFAHSAILFRKSEALRFGGYDSGLRRIEDYDLWLKLGTVGILGNLPESLVAWRAPSRQRRNRYRARLYDHLVKMRLLWRHRGQYPGFWRSSVIDFLKILPYAVMAVVSC
jgi:glycosyltransferase involved in cell wall biosynthesis